MRHNLTSVCYGCRLLAGVDVLGAQTCLTLDVAAPLEAALAAFGQAPSLRVVAASTAQLVATVQAVRAALTPPTPRPGGTGHHGRVDRVRLAVVRRRIDVDQIVACRTSATDPRPAPTTVASVLPRLLLVRRYRIQ